MTEAIRAAKQELEQLSNIEQYLKSIKRQRDEIYTKYTSLKAVNYENSGCKAMSDAESRIVAAIDKLQELDDLLAENIIKAQETEIVIRDKILKVPYPYSEMLTRRYIDHQRYEKIAVEMGYSYHYVASRAFPTALKKYSEI